MNSDVRIIDDIIKAIENGECIALRSVEAELRSLRARLAPESVSERCAGDELRLLLNRESAFALEARRVVAMTAIRFLETQIEHYSRLAEGRELTEDEKRFGRESLIPMIEEIRALFDPQQGIGGHNT